jgi:hypothetical protein
LNQPFPEDEILRDIVRYNVEKSHPQMVLDGMMLMKTKSGQQWVVKITSLPNNSFQIRYCDGSMSRLTQIEINTFGTEFYPLPEKSSSSSQWN